jgi:hypothetical protein
VDAGGIGKDQAAVFHFAEPLKMPGGAKFTITLDYQVNTAHCIGRPRVSIWSEGTPALNAVPIPAEVLAAAEKLQKQESLSDAERAAVYTWRKSHDAGWQKRQAALAKHISKPSEGKTPVMVCAEGFQPIVMHSQGPPFLKTTHQLKRGDTNQKQEEAKLGVLQIFNRTGDLSRWKWEPPAGSKFQGRRRTLANWITDVEQGAGALMARTTANRLWQYHFGRGIVSTPNDLGRTGSLPSHPELLEWLATELVSEKWKIKPLHRLLMLSSAYRQSSVADSAKQAADPENQWFMQRIPNRLEAEIVRDSALAVAGALEAKLYGKGTLDENSTRRSIYFTIKRSQLVNSMVVFDAPEPLTSQGNRPTTTVAPQALLLMNSPQIRTWAAAFAKRIQQDFPPPANGDFSAHIRHAYHLALGRDPRPSEIAISQRFISSGLPAGHQTALTDFCQSILSLNEFAYSN